MASFLAFEHYPQDLVTFKQAASMFASFISWTIQTWLSLTGRKRAYADHPWLRGPQGISKTIGENFYAEYAAAAGLETAQPEDAGLMPDFSVLSDTPQPQLHPRVAHFYEHTARYSLDVWSQ